MTPFELAERFVGIEEVPGKDNNPQIMAMLKLDGKWPQDDEVPWCSAFMNYICWLSRLSRSKSLMARSWLDVGVPIQLETAYSNSDIVILWRGAHPQPGPEVTNAPGHVGFFAGYDAIHEKVYILGGNQGDTVRVSPFPTGRVLGVRRLGRIG